MKITRDEDARAGRQRKPASSGRGLPPREPHERERRRERGRWRAPAPSSSAGDGGPYLLVLPLLGLSGGARGDGAAQGPAARLTVEVGRADVGWGDGGGGGGEGDEGPAPRGGRLVAVLRGDGGVRPDGGRRQAGGRAGRPQGRHRGGGPLRGRHRGVSCGGRTENG